MTSIYIAIFIVILVFTIFVPFYLAGRLWFVFSPFAINYYAKEKAIWYNDWNTQRFLIVLILFFISLALSLFWGWELLTEIQTMNIDLTQLLFYTLLQILTVILFEVKMEHPFKPIQAFKKFKEKSYNERFAFREKQNSSGNIENHSGEIKEEISLGYQQQEQTLPETNEFAILYNKILQESDFAFEIKNSKNLAISEILKNYMISEDSEKVLFDFLIRKKNSGKILFTKPARNGVSVQPILDFFSTFTNLIDNCRSNNTTQADTVKIINSISSAKGRRGNIVDEPINAKNFSKYLSSGDLREVI